MIKNLSFAEQIDLFESRGILFDNNDDKIRSARTLEFISYYKIKEIARPFEVRNVGQEDVRYNPISFSYLMSRYYQDKNLRIYLLHAIEQIEVAIKTQTAYVLGNKYGAFGYLNFGQWCDKQEYCKHYLKYKEDVFKRNLREFVKRSGLLRTINSNRFNKDNYSAVWFSINLLTFGQLVDVLELMSRDSLTQIADKFECERKELLSWLKCLNLIRNTCAHNSIIIDFRLKTEPIIKDEWKQYLYQNHQGKYSNRIALPILIIKHLVVQSQKNYKLNDINDSLRKLIKDDSSAKYFGFKDSEAAFSIIGRKKRRFSNNVAEMSRL